MKLGSSLVALFSNDVDTKTIVSSWVDSGEHLVYTNYTVYFHPNYNRSIKLYVHSDLMKW